MGDTGYDFGQWKVKVDGKLIIDPLGVQNPEISNSAPTEIPGGGGKVHGHATRTKANGVNYAFTVAQPSANDADLDALSQSSVPITLEVYYEDPSALPDKAYIGFTTRGRIHAGVADYADEPGEKSYTFMGIGYTKRYKNAPDLVVS